MFVGIRDSLDMDRFESILRLGVYLLVMEVVNGIEGSGLGCIENMVVDV